MIDSHNGQTALLAEIEEVSEEFQHVFQELVSLMDKFCSEYLNEEYKHVCHDMAMSICQPDSPVKRGKRASWACGIVYTAGWVNFLADPSQQPHVRSEDIAKWFGVSVATMRGKSKII